MTKKEERLISNFRVMLLACIVSVTAISCEMIPDDPATAQAQMAGTWNYKETTGNACQMQISASGNDGLRITNFACTGLTIQATLNENTLTIPRQTVSGDTFEGSGTIRKYETMVLTFVYNDGRESVNITANCTKQ